MWRIEAKFHFVRPCTSSLNCHLLIFFVFWLPSWHIVKAIWVNFWPKSNLRPVLWLHRSLLGPQKCQNMLTKALFLIPNDVKDPVVLQLYLSHEPAHSQPWPGHIAPHVPSQGSASHWSHLSYFSEILWLMFHLSPGWGTLSESSQIRHEPSREW